MKPKHKLVADRYLQCLNGAQAYQDVYACKRSTAGANFDKLLKNTEFFEYISKRQAENVKEAQIKAQDVLRELARIGTVDPSLAFDSHGNPLPIHEIPEDVRRAIASYDVVPVYSGEGEHLGDIRKIKFWSKTDGLHKLGLHLKLFTEQIEIKDTSNLAEKIKRARERK